MNKKLLIIIAVLLGVLILWYIVIPIFLELTKCKVTALEKRMYKLANLEERKILIEYKYVSKGYLAENGSWVTTDSKLVKRRGWGCKLALESKI